jgi:hypothetical protein
VGSCFDDQSADSRPRLTWERHPLPLIVEVEQDRRLVRIGQPQDAIHATA